MNLMLGEGGREWRNKRDKKRQKTENKRDAHMQIAVTLCCLVTSQQARFGVGQYICFLIPANGHSMGSMNFLQVLMTLHQKRQQFGSGVKIKQLKLFRPFITPINKN